MPIVQNKGVFVSAKTPLFLCIRPQKPEVLTFLFFFSFSAHGRQEIYLLPFLFGWQLSVGVTR